MRHARGLIRRLGELCGENTLVSQRIRHNVGILGRLPYIRNVICENTPFLPVY